MNAQDALWVVPNALGHGWWYIVSVFALASTFTMFIYMIMNEKFSGLWLSRVIIWAGMVCLALVPLNSGLLPWAAMFAAIGCFYASFLIATDWCNRHDRWEIFSSLLKTRKEQHHARQRPRSGPSD